MIELPLEQKKIATDITLRAINRVIAASSKKLAEYWTKHRAREVSLYTEYLFRKGVLANTVRNFIYDMKSASLYQIYVPTTITDGLFTGDQLLQTLCTPDADKTKRPTRALAIVGNAGTGKSLFMKHAFFYVQKLQAARVPILIEVRTFNRLKKSDLETKIISDFEAIGTVVTSEQILLGLQAGLFVILLDGLDELKGSLQKHYESALMEFSIKFPECPILISSRPTQRMYSWENFDIRRIAPLNLLGATDLIGRLEFDENVKAAFKDLLKGSLFRTHYDFVSVPLLCIIMLLTYSDSGYIAKDQPAFFEDAFTALWSKHDGRKVGFERHRFTNLHKSEFARLLAAFAISSYSSADYNMRENHFKRHFEAAVGLSDVHCSESEFLEDLTVSTSLAVEDGPYIRFCHRSFQEYFAAIFICEVADSSAECLIEDLSDRIETDIVLPLVLAINDEKIEKHWVLPKTKIIREFIEIVGGRLELYIHNVFGKVETSNPISSTAAKIRNLYKFKPDLETLQAAYDAARDMNISAIDLTTDPSAMENIFKRDCANFVALNERLIQKYDFKKSALAELLNRDRDA